MLLKELTEVYATAGETAYKVDAPSLLLVAETPFAPQQMVVWTDTQFEFNPLAIQTLPFSQYLGEPTVESGNSSALQTLGFSQTADNSVVGRYEVAAQTLSFSQTADNGVTNKFSTAAQTLGFSQTADSTGDYLTVATQTLPFSQLASIGESALQELVFSQTTGDPVVNKFSAALQSLDFLQAADNSYVATTARQTLSFTQSVTCSGSYVSAASQTLPLTQLARTDEEKIAYTVIPFMQKVVSVQNRQTVITSL